MHGFALLGARKLVNTGRSPLFGSADGAETNDIGKPLQVNEMVVPRREKPAKRVLYPRLGGRIEVRGADPDRLNAAAGDRPNETARDPNEGGCHLAGPRDQVAVTKSP